MTTSNGFSTGHEKIDNQHQELFHLVTLLDQAIASHDRCKLESIIIFLEDYVDHHFKDEESVMKSAQFSGLDQHHEEHEEFRHQVSLLRKSYDSELPGTHLIFKIRRFIDTLVIHIKTVDILISDIMREQS